MTELSLIHQVTSRLKTQSPKTESLPIPPGDDCALVAATNKGVLFAADMLMDQVHFDLRSIPPELAGRKALAVNLSDIAAMAGTPTAVTVSLALPRHMGMELGQKVMEGVISLAREYDVAVAGGDTNGWDGPLVINVAIIGDPHPRGSVRRQGAAVGEWIMTTGRLGGSIGGRHLTFSPRVKEARLLHTHYGLSSMIDLSDGLGTDLRHILTMSGVGAQLLRSAIPVHPACFSPGISSAQALEHALVDGEDFELLFTVPASTGQAILRDQPLGNQVPVSHIGEITAQGAITWEDGAPITWTGYTHAFR